MLAVVRNELLKLFKSIKSIIIILIFVLVSYFISNLLKSNVYGLNISGNNSFYSSIRLLVFMLGYIFASTLSHNVINEEIELQTIRLVITKISKSKFFIGKFLGVFIFWILCITTSFSIISVLANTFNIYIFLMLIVCMFYFISLIFLLSTIIKKQALSNFIGIILGFIIPISGMWATLADKNIFFKIFKYLFPYHYLINQGFYILVPAIIGIALFLLSLQIFIRKDL